MKQGGRIEWLDILKGIAIFLVVLGHSGISPVKDPVYAFHMPLFFMLAGYTASLSYTRRNNALSFAKGRFLSLFIPMLTWGLFKSLFFCSREEFLGFDITPGLHDIVYGTPNAWFLPTLLCMQVFYIAYELIVRRFRQADPPRRHYLFFAHGVTILVLMSVLFGLHRVFGKSLHGLGTNIEWLTNAYIFAPSFIIGALLHRKGGLYIKLAHTKSHIVLAATCLVSLLFWGQVGTMGFLNGNYVRTIVGSCISYTLIVAVANSKIPAWFSSQACLIGRHTLIIYLAAGLFQARGFCHFEGFNALLAAIIYGATSLAACYACILFAVVVEKSPLLALLLLGKYPPGAKREAA